MTKTLPLNPAPTVNRSYNEKLYKLLRGIRATVALAHIDGQPGAPSPAILAGGLQAHLYNIVGETMGHGAATAVQHALTTPPTSEELEYASAVLKLCPKADG